MKSPQLPSQDVIIPMEEEEEEEAGRGGSEIKSYTSHTEWKCCGYKLPQEEIVYFAQICPLYIVIMCAIANLTLQRGDTQTWILLLGSCLGYLLPNPTLHKKKRK